MQMLSMNKASLLDISAKPIELSSERLFPTYDYFQFPWI